MSADRPAKQRVRSLWVDIVAEFDSEYQGTDVPLYLTLCGGDGKDILQLAEHQIVELTEVGGIKAEHERKIVAVEDNKECVYRLQRAIPGLKILEQNFRNLIVSESLIRYPTGDMTKVCSAWVINLDLQQPLKAEQIGGTLSYPILTWVQKLGQLHAAANQEKWCLCLTLNASLLLPPGACIAMQNFLDENFRRIPAFKASCNALLGPDLVQSISAASVGDFASLQGDAQQRLLMAFVPKQIVQLVHSQGWHVSTEWNLYYGGERAEAPIVTWVFLFRQDSRSMSSPGALYDECVNGSLRKAGRITQDGTLVELNV